MAKHEMDCGTIVDTGKASRKFEETTQWNGKNHISNATKDQWVHETLYQSAKGRWYVVTTSQWQGSTPSARFVTAKEAAHWLLVNEYSEGEIPEELHEHLEAICE